MCDYSLMHLKSRAAKKGDKLTSGPIPGSSTNPQPSWGTRGLYDPAAPDTAVCLLPGTEVAFMAAPVTFLGVPLWMSKQAVATFRQINKEHACMHHDAFEFRSGEIKLVHDLKVGQVVKVLSIPAKPKTEVEAKEQERLPVTA